MGNRNVNREIRAVYQGSLDQVLGKIRDRHRKKPEATDSLHQDGIWNSTGALKLRLIEHLTREQNNPYSRRLWKTLDQEAVLYTQQAIIDDPDT